MILPIQHAYLRVQSALRHIAQWLASLLEGKHPKSNIASLDGVRAIACLSVVTFHLSLLTTRDLPLWKPGDLNPLITAVVFSGDTGVTLFFILSGFLLFLPYAKALLFEDTRWPSARLFYLRRALRIIPAYYVSLFLMILLFRPDYLQPDHLRQLFIFLTLFMDSSPLTYRQLNGPFWTLAVEWQFYLLLPLLAFGISLLVRRGSLRRRLWTLIVCLGILLAWGIFSRYEGLYLTAHPKETLLLLPRPVLDALLPFIYGASNQGVHGKYLEDFAIGMLVSTCYTLYTIPTLSRTPSTQGKVHTLQRYLHPGLLGAGLLWLLLMAMWKFNQGALHTWPIFDYIASFYDYLGEVGFAIGYGLLVAGVLFGPAWLKRPFEWTPLRWIGIISYGIYMWHLLLIEFFMDHVVRYLKSWPPLALYLLYWGWVFFFIVPCALLLFILIEKPCMRLANRKRA